jgi:hypothetical protein
MTPISKLTKLQRLAIAAKVAPVLRSLNRPPRRIRTPSGWTDSHKIARAALLRLDVEFGLPIEEQWQTCAQCGHIFLTPGARRRSFCSKSCSTLAWRAQNTEKVREYSRSYAKRHPESASRWRREHPEGRRAVGRAYANKPAAKAKRRAWRDAHPERVRELARRAQQRYRDRDPDNARALQRTPEARARKAAWARANRATKKRGS